MSVYIKKKKHALAYGYVEDLIFFIFFLCVIETLTVVYPIS